MHNLLKVEGHDGLVRDPNSGAIINVNSSSYAEYVAASKKVEAEKQELNNIRSELAEVKSLLLKLLKKE